MGSLGVGGGGGNVVGFLRCIMSNNNDGDECYRHVEVEPLFVVGIIFFFGWCCSLLPL